MRGLNNSLATFALIESIFQVIQLGGHGLICSCNTEFCSVRHAFGVCMAPTKVISFLRNLIFRQSTSTLVGCLELACLIRAHSMLTLETVPIAKASVDRLIYVKHEPVIEYVAQNPTDNERKRQRYMSLGRR